MYVANVAVGSEWRWTCEIQPGSECPSQTWEKSQNMTAEAGTSCRA